MLVTEVGDVLITVYPVWGPTHDPNDSLWGYRLESDGYYGRIGPTYASGSEAVSAAEDAVGEYQNTRRPVDPEADAERLRRLSGAR